MSMTLRPETERQIEEQMKHGQFASPDDLLQAALRLLGQRQRDLDEVRRKIALGIEQLDRGEGLDGDSVFEQLLAELDRGDEKPGAT